MNMFMKYYVFELMCLNRYEYEYEYEPDMHINMNMNMNKYNGKMGFYLECNRGRLVHTLSCMNMISYTYDDCELSVRM